MELLMQDVQHGAAGDQVLLVGAVAEVGLTAARGLRATRRARAVPTIHYRSSNSDIKLTMAVLSWGGNKNIHIPRTGRRLPQPIRRPPEGLHVFRALAASNASSCVSRCVRAGESTLNWERGPLRRVPAGSGARPTRAKKPDSLVGLPSGDQPLESTLG